MSTPGPLPCALLPHPAVFLPDPVPRRGRLAFWAPEGAPLPDAAGIPGHGQDHGGHDAGAHAPAVRADDVDQCGLGAGD
ncbi:hypothetical protein, partial [Streptomyces toxytricini]|uniref:hypothetical protein n=1 Tax=Streptomyces toxytricini TaxID=67369 RepID=UPI0034333EE7